MRHCPERPSLPPDRPALPQGRPYSGSSVGPRAPPSSHYQKFLLEAFTTRFSLVPMSMLNGAGLNKPKETSSKCILPPPLTLGTTVRRDARRRRRRQPGAMSSLKARLPRRQLQSPRFRHVEQRAFLGDHVVRAQLRDRILDAGHTLGSVETLRYARKPEP